VGPGSAEQREERCTASGTRLLNRSHPHEFHALICPTTGKNQ
jgi:hypothetical protein